jgi:CubicO group peptidase (beta-lactamase class C family)
VYVQQHVFAPLGLDARYLPASKACGAHTVRGAAVAWAPDSTDCTADTWNADLLPRIAPTSRDEDGEPAVNPDRNALLRGTVQDTTARRMGGVAGHAGVFATARDISVYAQALLDRLAGRPSTFPLSQQSLQLMTTPQQPGHTPQQVQAANDAARAEHRATPSYPLLALRYPAIRGQNLRGFGWDIDTGQSTTRGAVFPVGGFGHTGFTGTSVWIDPASDTYVVLLTNSVHTRGSAPISDLRGGVATLAARALHLYGSS